MRPKIRAVLIAALIILVLISFAWLLGPANAREEAPEAPASMRYIIHAGGVIDGNTNTNSLEAIQNAYDQGNRVIEIDFNITNDGCLVCTHDWGLYRETGLDLDGFLAYDRYEGLTSMTADDLAEFLREKPDLFIVTDVKENNLTAIQRLRDSYPDLTRQFIVQIYSEEEYSPVREMGFQHIIYTLYNCTWDYVMDTDHLIAFAQENELFGYTYSAELWDVEGYTEKMLAAGVSLFVHTVNDPETQQYFFDLGITGIYTDNTIHQ